MLSMQRMADIIALLEAHPQGITVQELAEACGVPPATMGCDLETLASSPESRLPFYTDHDEEDTDEDEIFKPHVRWFLAKTDLRFTPVYLTVPEMLIILDVLSVHPQGSHLRESLQCKIIAGFDFREAKAYRYIKGNRQPEHVDAALIEVFDQAIRQARILRMCHNERELQVLPLGLVYYSRLRRWYLVAQDAETIKTYNVAQIRQARLTAQTFAYPAEFSLAEWFAPRWGMEYGEPLTVKVRFSNRFQTFAKVRKDAAHRQTRLTLSQDGQSLIMEDVIIGKNEFCAWLLGFGSAAEVLEPESLRQEIVELAKATLMNYRVSASVT